MKKIDSKWTSLSIVICLIGLILSGASGNDDEHIVEQLLRKRTDIMENTLSGKITFKEGKSQLREIEEGKLYSDDIKGMMAFMNGDYDKIISMDVLGLKKVSDISDVAAFDGEIRWTYQGMDEIYLENNKYYIGTKREDDKLKLVSFELLE